MTKIYLEIVSWPEGYGLAISDSKGDHCYTIAGAHGGGIGKTLKRYAIDPDGHALVAPIHQRQPKRQRPLHQGAAQIRRSEEPGIISVRNRNIHKLEN